MMRRMAHARWSLIAVLVTGCGGASRTSGYQLEDIRLIETPAGHQWFHATSTCAQGPYEVEAAATGAKWGEDVDLRVITPRNLGLHAVLIVDGKELETKDGVFGAGGNVAGKPDNARCIADARERLVLGRTGGGGSGGPPGTPGTPGTLVRPPPDRPSVTPQLDLDTSVTVPDLGTVLLQFHLPERAPGTPLPRIRFRLWSVEPNDLEGVLFGWTHREWRPNVSEQQYEAHLRWKVEEARRADEQWRREHPPEAPRAGVVVKVDLERERRREEARRRREAAEAEHARRRTEFCASHPKDRGCWGAGGLEVHLDLKRRRDERDAYCAAHGEDARCWDDAEWSRRRAAWDDRRHAATAPPKPPDGPPPAALVEDVPPKLSAHADWRPGYWEWTSGRWVWLAGMWRVPDEDIASEQTTTAPAAPPPEKPEVAPAAPVQTAVWLAGFWQWNGTGWVWIAGSWQLPPQPQATWRAPEWQPRGRVHILIPGGWIRIGGRP